MSFELGLRGGALLAALALGLTGCDLFFVEADDSRACSTSANQPFAAPADAGVTETRTEVYLTSFGNELLQINGHAVDTKISILDVTFTAHDGVTDLGFLDAATTAVAPTVDAGVSNLKVLEYVRAQGEDPGDHIVLKGSGGDDDITPYLQGGQLKLTSTLTGIFPDTTWLMDVKTCVSLKARYEYFK